jgi:hypothetical protein
LDFEEMLSLVLKNQAQKEESCSQFYLCVEPESSKYMVFEKRTTT